MKASQFKDLATKAGFKNVAPVDETRGVYSFDLNGIIDCRAFLFPPGGPNVSALQLFAGFNGTFDINEVNAWNRSFRFVKTYLFDSGDLAVEMDIILEGAELASLTTAHNIWTGNVMELPNHFN